MVEQIKGLDRFAENYALYRNFMGYVKEKYPKIYKEYWDEVTKEEDLIQLVFSKVRDKAAE